MLTLCVAFAFLLGCHPKTIADLPSQYVSMHDGSKIHYKVSGSGSITLLFVHGFGCDMNVWQKQYEGFVGDPIRMIFIDLPGFGNSDKPHTDYTLDFFSQAVNQVLDTLKASHVVLVGHSLGTAVCRQTIFNYPDKVSALCDIDGVYCFYPYHENDSSYARQLASFAEGFRGDSCGETITSFVESLEGPFTPQEVMDYALSIMPKTPEYVAYSTMHNLIEPDNWTGEVINIPVLVMCTKNSGLDKDNKSKMDDLYNEMTYVEVENSGHFIMMEDGDIVNNLIERLYEKWKITVL